MSDKSIVIIYSVGFKEDYVRSNFRVHVLYKLYLFPAVKRMHPGAFLQRPEACFAQFGSEGAAARSLFFRHVKHDNPPSSVPPLHWRYMHILKLEAGMPHRSLIGNRNLVLIAVFLDVYKRLPMQIVNDVAQFPLTVPFIHVPQVNFADELNRIRSQQAGAN